MYRSILVAIDGSEHSRHALEVALALASGENATVRVLTVPEWPRADDPLGIAAGARSLDVTEEDVLQTGQDLVEQALSELKHPPAVEVIPMAALGDVADVILSQAEETGVDAIVLGSRGLSDLKGMVVGSVSHKVMHAAPCRTIIVRA